MVNTFTQLTWGGDTLDDARHLIRLAVREDLSNQQDWTTMATVAGDHNGSVRIVSREAGVVAGIGIVQAVLDEMNISCECDVAIADGDRMDTPWRAGIFHKDCIRIS